MILKVGGIVLLAGSVIGGFVMAGGTPLILWQPPEYLIIIGGAVAAFMVSNSANEIRSAGRALKGVFFDAKMDEEYYQKLLTLLYQLFELRRRSGVAVLEEHIDTPGESSIFTESGILENPKLTSFICDNLRMVTMGKVQTHELEGLLDSEVATMEDELMRPSHSIQVIADALPGFGIVAAVLGIVITMGAMSGPVEVIGSSIAKALVGTFLGILFSYGLVGPLAQAIEHSVVKQIQLYSCVKTAIVAMVSGKSSSVSVDAGRRVLYSDVRPSFDTMEAWLKENRT